MYDIEATVTQTDPTVLKLAAYWPVDWLRETGFGQWKFSANFFMVILEIPSVLTERPEVNGNRSNWPRL
jgi:hypothetical protein